MVAKGPKTVGEINTFVTMLRVACENKQVRKKLERLLVMPDEQRQTVVNAWVRDLLIAEAPQDFINAIACLADDRISEKAYEAIFECKR